MRYTEHFERLCEALEGPGAFLVVEAGGRVNAMTIGWAQLGVIWGEPIMSVLVRPSRHTFKMLEKAAGFTVCVPRRGELKKELGFCGSRSGREHDKLLALGLKARDGAAPGLKYIEGCELVYHCERYGEAGLAGPGLAAPALGKYYPAGDLHTVYFGRVIKAEKF